MATKMTADPHSTKTSSWWTSIDMSPRAVGVAEGHSIEAVS
jgi:hypothetical protein